MAAPVVTPPPQNTYPINIQSVESRCHQALDNASTYPGWNSSITSGDAIDPAHAMEAEELVSILSVRHLRTKMGDEPLNAARNRAQTLRNIHATDAYESTDVTGMMREMMRAIARLETESKQMQGSMTQMQGSMTQIQGSITQIQGSITQMQDSIKQMEGSLTQMTEKQLIMEAKFDNQSIIQNNRVFRMRAQRTRYNGRRKLFQEVVNNLPGRTSKR
ncbi:hypothetical protein AMATHDRAFT_7163 [Amanita thiersii Skay4041]|uniref:Uncharacterized protein n=1 Tax=Amanita thiersii Skay4041 TaxID=703135 RepID=A0A2A9NA97_9AGAR|nr:hypothetical protein AMATHDRAFT_7163 [Amanita thiersii Skay4041]